MKILTVNKIVPEPYAEVVVNSMYYTYIVYKSGRVFAVNEDLPNREVYDYDLPDGVLEEIRQAGLNMLHFNKGVE